MSDKIAKEDITVQDGNGRTVVVVPKGKPIPEDLEAEKAKFAAVEHHVQDEAPVEDKAKRSSRGK